MCGVSDVITSSKMSNVIYVARVFDLANDVHKSVHFFRQSLVAVHTNFILILCFAF